MTKRYLGSRSDKAIGYTVCTYGMYSIRLQHTVDVVLLLRIAITAILTVLLLKF